MKKLIVLSVLMILVCHQLQAQDSNSRFQIRNSANIFWNTGWEDRFFHCSGWWEIRGDSLIMGPWNCAHVPQQTTLVNPELWWKAYSTKRVDFFLTLGYQHSKISLRDSMTFSDIWQFQDALEARLHFFSTGARVQLKSLPFKPYVGENVGYCLGRLVTVQLNVDPDTKQLHHYMLVDGSGGGVFVDLLAGAQQKLWRQVSVFVEGGYRFTPEWSDFKVDSVYGNKDWRSIALLAGANRNIRVKGPYVALGLQIGL
jgi:hypothetical protein